MRESSRWSPVWSRHLATRSGAKLLGDAIGRDAFVEDRLVEMVEHAVAIFAGVLEVLTDDFHGTKTDDAEEQLGGEIGLADAQYDPVSALGGKLANQLRDHLTSHAV